MQSLFLALFTALAALQFLPVPASAIALPSLPCNTTGSGATLNNEDCAGAPRAIEKAGVPTSLSLAAGPRLPDPFTWPVPGGTQVLIFTHWGNKFPVFDHVVDLIEKVELELENEIKAAGGDQRMEVSRTWSFNTAQLKTYNALRARGMSHRELLRFLGGLRTNGMVYGFWACDIEFHDSRFMMHLRGKGVLSSIQPAEARAQA
ncbi:MAG: hypothetical protein LQ338_002884 [Usnochroma carphineum]|nr:MAG: hypothetical protein LQ338_002884 [Usnochroma carphineum]